VEDEFRPLVLPTLKFVTRKIYTLLLDKHLLPRFGEECIADIATPEVQRFVLDKLTQGYAWETASHDMYSARCSALRKPGGTWQITLFWAWRCRNDSNVHTRLFRLKRFEYSSLK